MYHLQITKSMHNKEISGRKISVITDKDYENLEAVDHTLKDQLAKSINDLDFDNNECLFESREQNVVANYYIRLEEFN